MARTTNKLSATAVKSAKFEGKARKLFDGGGLFLHIKASGKYWRMKYRFGGREKLLAIGVFPETSLQAARQARDDARTLLAEGKDPGREKQAQKARQKGGGTFEGVAQEWLDLQKPRLAPATHQKTAWLLSLLFPRIGRRPINELGPPEVLAALRRIESRGTHETAHRAKQKAGQVFRYAIATGQAERDPTAELRGALAPIVRRSHSALTRPEDIGALLRAIDGYEGQFTVASALRLAPLVFVRPGELRTMEWAELDLDAREWRIPAHKMKMRELHIVPLSAQALEILRDLEPITGHGRYAFPSLRSTAKPMSENTLNAALRRLGYSGDEMTAHGFRAMASTRLNEMGWNPEIIERQLAHAERNKVRAAYNRAQHLNERRRMMQAWADYLDSLRQGSTVVPIRKQTNSP